MEKIIKEFVCTTKVGDGCETNSIFRAVLKCSYDMPYRILVSSQKFRFGHKVSQCETELYFANYEEMAKEFKYKYSLCKGNLFTEFIKITK